MKYLIFILTILFVYNVSYAQGIYYVYNISDNYYGKIYLNEINNYSNNGWIAIYDYITNKEIIRNNFDRLFISNDIIVNSNEIPYGSQKFIAYDDFNFDGINDFALEDGQHGGYGADTYKIFLYEGGEFVYNEDLTNLNQSASLGLFKINHEHKTLTTYTKSGCCLHQEAEYIVIDNKPILIKTIGTDSTRHDGYIIVTVEKLKKGKWVKSVKKYKEKDYNKLNH